MPTRVRPLAGAPPSPRSRERIVALDAARALGVVAMVYGHTLDALLVPAAWTGGGMQTYWRARGITAPLFMLVAGWAVTVSIRRGGARGGAVVRGRLPRALLLVLIGATLRFPGWDLRGLGAGSLGPWAHLLAFDTLQTIGVSILVAAGVLSLPLGRREIALAFAALLLLAVALGLDPPRGLPRPSPALLGAQALGGTSPFPLVPWMAYFLAGALLGVVAPERQGRGTALAMVAVGVGLVVATAWQGIGTAPPAAPPLIAFRIGALLLVLAALSSLPSRVAAAVAPVGRLSLGAYAFHVPLVYGWSTFQGLSGWIGRRLSLGAGLAAGAAVLAASLAAASALQAGARRLRRAVGDLRPGERALGAPED